jgi:hypothetical protein
MAVICVESTAAISPAMVVAIEGNTVISYCTKTVLAVESRRRDAAATSVSSSSRRLLGATDISAIVSLSMDNPVMLDSMLVTAATTAELLVIKLEVSDTVSPIVPVTNAVSDSGSQHVGMSFASQTKDAQLTIGLFT